MALELEEHNVVAGMIDHGAVERDRHARCGTGSPDDRIRGRWIRRMPRIDDARRQLQISRQPQASLGIGLARSRSRFSVTDDLKWVILDGISFLASKATSPASPVTTRLVTILSRPTSSTVYPTRAWRAREVRDPGEGRGMSECAGTPGVTLACRPHPFAKSRAAVAQCSRFIVAEITYLNVPAPPTHLRESW